MKEFNMQEDNTGQEPLIFYCYEQMTDIEAFCRLAEEKFHAAGHRRPIEFRRYDCYEKAPERDGDLYVFDGMVLSAYAAQGLICEIPEKMVGDDVFEWVRDGSFYENRMYGIPFIVCTDVLISRKENDIPIRNIYGIKEEISAAMRPMLAEYYLFAYFNSPYKGDGALKGLRYLNKLVGGRKVLMDPEKAEAESRERFIRKQCRFLLGFSEVLRFLPREDYVLRRANISDGSAVELPFFYVNYVSIGAEVPREKLADCEAMLAVIASDEFVMEFAEDHGKMRYILPAKASLYEELMKKDDLYRQLYKITADQNNCVLRCGKNFYEEYPKKAEELLKFLSRPERKKGLKYKGQRQK